MYTLNKTTERMRKRETKKKKELGLQKEGSIAYLSSMTSGDNVGKKGEGGILADACVENVRYTKKACCGGPVCWSLARVDDV